MREDELLPFVEPVYRFCRKRLSRREDAEDLAGDILLAAVEGIGKYEISSLDAWIWRVAHNRYARFMDSQSKNRMILTGETELFDRPDPPDDPSSRDELVERVMETLHTLSSSYRDLFVDHYLAGLSVKELAKKYGLTETSVKWRLNVGREKIRERTGEISMQTAYYHPFDWRVMCNGNMDPMQYLGTQIARAVAFACYERPLSAEEISLKTGIPALYVEDELERLIEGDAVRKIGGKYAADFIIFRASDQKKARECARDLSGRIADWFEALIAGKEEAVASLPFYGHDFGLEKLGWFLLPCLLRRRILEVMTDRLSLSPGPYPLRKDGGKGWFVVEELGEDDTAAFECGCNVAGDDDGSAGRIASQIYYYWVEKFFDVQFYHGYGARFLTSHDVAATAENGKVTVPLAPEAAAALLENGLLTRREDGLYLSFARFEEEEFRDFLALFQGSAAEVDALLEREISSLRAAFASFVPSRLESQINQWVQFYVERCVGMAADELLRRGVLRAPDAEKPLTDGIFFVGGAYIDP